MEMFLEIFRKFLFGKWVDYIVIYQYQEYNKRNSFRGKDYEWDLKYRLDFGE